MTEDVVPEQFCADCSFVKMISPSPNFGERGAGSPMDMIILHYTGMVSQKEALDWLCSEESQVSCHYFVFEDGNIAQLMPEKKRAWHAGKSFWRGETDINSRSIGIEIANPGHEFGYIDFPIPQMDAVVKLVEDIVQRHQIPSDHILAHSDVAPIRKRDPGERFDWRALHLAGLGNWIKPSPIRASKELKQGDRGEAVRKFQNSLRELGFGVENNGKFDALTFACVRAFQRHFRQERVDGIADESTVDTLNHLLDKFGRSNVRF